MVGFQDDRIDQRPGLPELGQRERGGLEAGLEPWRERWTYLIFCLRERPKLGATPSIDDGAATRGNTECPSPLANTVLDRSEAWRWHGGSRKCTAQYRAVFRILILPQEGGNLSANHGHQKLWLIFTFQSPLQPPCFLSPSTFVISNDSHPWRSS